MNAEILGRKGDQMNFFLHFPELFLKPQRQLSVGIMPGWGLLCIFQLSPLPPLPPILQKHVHTWSMDNKTKERQQLGPIEDFSCGHENMGGDRGRKKISVVSALLFY